MGTADRALKYFSLLIFAVGTIGDSVSQKRITYAANFPVALTQLTALVGAIVYPLLVTLAVALRWAKCSQLCLPLWKPACIAVLFVLHHSCLNTGAGGAAVPGVMVGVLVKFVIPFSMVFSMPNATLGIRYKIWHWLSFCVVIAGIVVTVNMSLTPLAPGVAVNIVLIILSTVPLAASFTLVEVSLTIHHKDLLAMGLWMWICFCQSLASLVLLPLSTWMSGVPISNMLPNLLEGMECYVTGTAPQGAGAQLDCQEAAKCWWANIGFGLMMNVGMCMSTRYGGATLMWFVRALTVPLAALCFAQQAIMGIHAVPMTPAQAMGVLIVFAGVLSFNAVEPGRRNGSPNVDNNHSEQLISQG